MSKSHKTGVIPDNLRAWQRFVADNLDFRLGVAVGAVVAEIWSAGAAVHGAATPDLATWRDTTGLPWFGFWIRELLRWGTLDPFVAFCLAQGLAATRETAAQRRVEFDAFILGRVPAPTPDDYIDPQNFLAWQRELPRREAAEAPAVILGAALTGTAGARGRYGVIPVTSREGTTWFDAAGFALAYTPGVGLAGDAHRSDFDLLTVGPARVERTFEWRSGHP